MKKTISALVLLMTAPLAFAGVKFQIVFPALEGAKIEKMEANSADHAYPYPQTNLTLRADFNMPGRLDLVDLANPKNNTDQDTLRHFTVLVTGKSKIDKLNSALNECLAGGEQMKKAKGVNKVVIIAEADEIYSGTYGGIAISGEGTEGDKRSVIKIDRLDQSRKFAAVSLLNPKSLSCKYISSSAATPKL